MGRQMRSSLGNRRPNPRLSAAPPTWNPISGRTSPAVCVHSEKLRLPGGDVISAIHSDARCRRAHRSAGPNDSTFLRGCQGPRNCSDVGCDGPDGSQDPSSLRYRGTGKSHRQTAQRSSGESDRSVCRGLEGRRTTISPRSRLSLQFVDPDPPSRVYRSSDRRFAASPVSLSPDGQARDCVSPAQTSHGAFTRSSRIRREKGPLGVSKKNAVKHEAPFELLYLDECEIHLHPTLAKMWTLRGIRPAIPAAGTNHKLCLYDALNYRTGQVHYLAHPRKNAQHSAEFLDQLLAWHRNTVLVLGLDNATYHHTREILDLLAEHESQIASVAYRTMIGRRGHRSGATTGVPGI